jgi:hypothetical protein
VGPPDSFIDYRIVDDVHITIEDKDSVLVESSGNLYIDYADNILGKTKAKGVSGFLSGDGKFVPDNSRDLLGREKTYLICHYDLEIIIDDEDCYFNEATQEVGLLREPLDNTSSQEENSNNEEEIF